MFVNVPLFRADSPGILQQVHANHYFSFCLHYQDVFVCLLRKPEIRKEYQNCNFEICKWCTFINLTAKREKNLLSANSNGKPA